MSATEATAAAVPSDTVFTTGDHKRLGRLVLGASLAFLVLGGVLGGLLSAEKASTGFDVLDEDSFGQVFSLHGVSAAYLFLLPAWLGIAMYVVPLQVGARNLALPRVAQAATFGYLIGGVILAASYLSDGGPTSGSNLDASELWMGAFGLVLLSLTAGLVSVVTTAFASRAPGLSLRQVPAFTWSMLVAGVLWILTLPVAAAALVLLWIDVHHGSQIVTSVTGVVEWAFRVPQLYLLAVPALGVTADVLATTTGARSRAYPGIAVGAGLLAVLSFGAYTSVSAGSEVRFDFLFQAMGFAAILPVLMCLGTFAGLVRRGPHLRLSAAALMATVSTLLLLLGVVAGAALSLDRFDLDATTWVAGQLHLVGLGAGTLGLFAGIWHWAPKIWGARLHEPLGLAAGVLLLVGTVVLATPSLVTGADDMPMGEPFYGADSTWEALSQAAGIGAAASILAVLVALVALGRLVMAAKDAPPDPWGGGQTLEWLAASPPPPHNFDELPEVLSEAPLLDAAARTEAPA